MRTGTNDPQLIDTAERRVFVLEKRKAGWTYQAIADAALVEFGSEKLPQGWDSRYAWMDVKREMKRINAERNEKADEVRRLELERLNDLLAGVWQAATTGDNKSINSALRIMERRARYEGLDAPTRQQNLNVDLSDLSTDQLERIANGEDVAHVLADTK